MSHRREWSAREGRGRQEGWLASYGPANYVCSFLSLLFMFVDRSIDRSCFGRLSQSRRAAALYIGIVWHTNISTSKHRHIIIIIIIFIDLIVFMWSLFMIDRVYIYSCFWVSCVVHLVSVCIPSHTFLPASNAIEEVKGTMPANDSNFSFKIIIFVSSIIFSCPL